MAQIDHLVFGCRDLDRGVAVVEEMTGVRPAPGGRHMGWGTHNALASLGNSYLEVIGVDPDQPEPPSPRPFGLDLLDADSEPRLLTFAVRPALGEAVEDLVAAAESVGCPFGQLWPMSRALPSGDALHWRLSDPSAMAHDGLVPFLLDWLDSPHPSASTIPGLGLRSMVARHRDPRTVQLLYEALEIDIEVREAPSSRLVAVLECPRGTVELS